MTLTLPLTTEEEAKLVERARAEGVTPETLIRRAIEPIISAGYRQATPSTGESRKSLVEFLMDSPFAGAELDLERRRDYPRPMDL